jgi:hypothetical protein
MLFALRDRLWLTTTAGVGSTRCGKAIDCSRMLLAAVVIAVIRCLVTLLGPLGRLTAAAQLQPATTHTTSKTPMRMIALMMGDVCCITV